MLGSSPKLALGSKIARWVQKSMSWDRSSSTLRTITHNYPQIPIISPFYCIKNVYLRSVVSRYALYTNFLRSLTNQGNESTLKDDFRLFLRVPGRKNTIFWRPNAIRWAAENYSFGALGPHLHGFFDLFLKWPSFPYNFLFGTLFFLFYAQSIDKHMENIPSKGFQQLSFYSLDKLAG